MNGHENRPGADDERDRDEPETERPAGPDGPTEPRPDQRHEPRPTPHYVQETPGDPLRFEPTGERFDPVEEEPPPADQRPASTPDEPLAEADEAVATGPDLDFPRPAPSSRPARIIALANQKGGVGKTTTVINLGASLAELGYRVLLVDMDPQGSLGVGLGIEPQALEATIYDLLLADRADPEDVIRRTDVDGLEVLPSNIDLAAAELTLVQEVAREHSLRRVLEQVRQRYDFVVIDCPPSLGLLTINGLTASDGVIIPLECEYFALRGMSLLMNTIEKIQARLNPDLELLGIVATMVDTRTLHAREVLARVHEAFGEAVFKTTIRRTIRFAEAPVAGEPILTYAPESGGTDAYRDLAREVLVRQQ